MRLSKSLDLIIAILFLCSFCLTIISSADDTINSRVAASFDIEFVTATDFKISVDLDVSEIMVFDTIYYSNEIQDIADSDLETMGAIKLRLRDLLENQIETLFENDDIVPIKNRPTYENQRFHDEFSVNLTSLFFGMNETIDAHDFINGVLDMGAEVYYNFNLQAEQGWNNTYTIILPASMNRPYTNGKVAGNEIQWDVRNGDDTNSEKEAKISIELVNPTTSTLHEEDIQLEFELDVKNAETPSLKTNILAQNVDIREYNILPDFITNLDFVPADGIRLFIDNSLISWDEFYQKTISSIEQKTKSIIENSSFNQSFDAEFKWDLETTLNCSIPYDITKMNNDPPVKAELTDENIDLFIYDISSRALFGLINSGATANITADNINFGDKLDEIGYPYIGLIHLPENIFLSGKNIYNWNQSNPVSGEFNSDIAPEYTKNEIETLVEIEVKNTDLNLLSFFTGQTELALTLYMVEGRNYSVTTLPNEFSLPEKISIEYLNSDAFRLCVEENLFNEEDIAAFLNSEKLLFENRLPSTLPGLEMEGHTNREAFDESLTSWSGDIADMDATPPVRVVSYSHSSYPLPFDISFLPPSFDVSNKSFNFQGVQNQDIKYKIIFPHGTSVAFSGSERAIKGITDDGREYIEVFFDASEAGLTENVTYKIYPSALFVIGIFMPCIVSFIITVILVVVIYILRKKRKGKKKAVVVEEEIDEDYEDQDYYVPPPPSSK